MKEIRSLAVIGGGTMGGGIAAIAASSGLQASLVDLDEERLRTAQARHEKYFARAVEKERMSSEEAREFGSRITYLLDLEGIAGVDWVVEAASEVEEVKLGIFAALPGIVGDDVVLSTNTSSISISLLAEAAGGAADRVIGMHFFNPVPVMKLVEVIRGSVTSDETLQRTMSLAVQLGKTPIPANDSPGFVSNRVLMPMINEAFHAWADGVAEAADIDEIMRLGCNLPMGPLRLADFIGLDVCRDIMHVMYEGLADEKYRPSSRLSELVAEGRLGDKTGRGVFQHDS